MTPTQSAELQNDHKMTSLYLSKNVTVQFLIDFGTKNVLLDPSEYVLKTGVKIPDNREL